MIMKAMVNSTSFRICTRIRIRPEIEEDLTEVEKSQVSYLAFEG